MHTYGHINISEVPKYQSAAVNKRLWNNVLHSSKTIINHNINGEKRLYIAAYIFENFIWVIQVVAYVTLFCIDHKVFVMIIVIIILIGQVIIVNQHLWLAVSIKPKMHHIAISICQTFMFIGWMWNFPYGGICPPQNSHVAHVSLENRCTHKTNGLYLNQIKKLINFDIS